MALDREKAKVIREAIEQYVDRQVAESIRKAPYDKIKYAKVVTVYQGYADVEIDKRVYQKIKVLRNVGVLSVGDVAICEIPNNDMSNAFILGVADGTMQRVGGGGGTSDHSQLSNLGYASSGHTGFQPTIVDLATIRSNASNAMPKSGGTFTGQVKFNTTSKTYNNGNIIGSKQADTNTVPNLIDELRFTNGQMGSVNLTAAYTLNNITMRDGWYNYIYIPHRGGGDSGRDNPDNCDYGTLILKGMTFNSPIYSIRLTNGSIANLDSTHTFTLSGTTLTIS